MDFARLTKKTFEGICVLAKFNPIELIGCLILRPGLTNSLAHVITKCCDLSRFVRKHNLTVARISAASICKNGVRKERHYPSKWTLLTNINIKSVDVKQSTRKLPSTKGRRFALGVEKYSLSFSRSSPLDSIKVIRVDFVECLLQISFLLLSQSIRKKYLLLSE